ncbi:MAG: hypothetical protein V2I33_25555 [Kangiellaceae bacterium]|nr:hypothetical protein [Kangiellaceae bacterium]
MPGHFKMEYEHRHDKYRSSIDPNIEDCVAVDLPTNLKYGSGGLDPQEAEHLRMIVLGLNEKLKSM